MDNDTSEATKEIAKAIQPINVSTVHKICSGQVVLSLATAVKELVENSLDARATIIEVKLRQQGIEMVEVSDNGEGVIESNFEGLTAKYHTSKLREFSDLECVETFGFRGEALSSLCALSKMVITTRHCTAEYGTRLELDERGTITKKSICARQTGTTVQLTDLFGSLPVRKREFTRNIKKEFVKMCHVLQGYCLVATGVRIICTNQNEKGLKSPILSTNGVESVLDNVTTVFGPKQRLELLKIISPIDLDEKLTKSVLEEIEPNCSSIIGDLEEVDATRFTINGWISSCKHGSGRSANDRQFIFINSRPCEPKKILKTINEIYRRFNGNQYPFVFLNILMQRSDVDVNLTPDKRQLLLNDEHVLIVVLKKCLLKTFGDIPSTFKMQNLNLTPPTTEKKSEFVTAPNPKKFMQMLTQWKKTGKTDNPCSSEKLLKRKVPSEVESTNMKIRKIQEFLSQNHDDTVAMSDDDSLSTTVDRSIVDNSQTSEMDASSNYLNLQENTSTPERPHEIKIEKLAVKIIDTYNGESVAHSSRNIRNDSPTSKKESSSVEIKVKHELSSPISNQNDCDTPKKDPCSSELKLRDDLPSSILPKLNRTPKKQQLEVSISKLMPKKPDESDSDSTSSQCNDVAEENSEEMLIEYDSENSFEEDQIGFKSQCTIDMYDTVSTSIDEIAELMKSEKAQRERMKRNNLDRLKFKATIDPSKNKLAEEELQTEITKESFSRMEIIGQFNVGFIVVKLDDDLFIVDQHATDEKYNYETLQKETTLYNQKLVNPQRLELTAVSEMILIDNIGVFEKNGFKFQIDHNALPTKKVQLTAKPMSKNWEFGKNEIDELLFLLQETPNTVLRPSKISAMFASRACRKSVMIGTALSRSDMRRLINQMGQIEQPWNCPHGRPTMRHLINLAMLDNSEDI